MKLTFLGAANTVTGSAYLVETETAKFIVDYGMFQGKESKLLHELPFPAGELDFAIISHAHVDHTGHLPILVKAGFSGPIYATPASIDLASILMADSAHIMKMDTEWKNKKRERNGLPPLQPLYAAADVDATTKLFEPVEYGDIKQLCSGVRLKFSDAGHILGSASAEVWLTEGDITKKVVFSGDLGNIDQPILKDPQLIKEADILLIESTYGNRLHVGASDAKNQLADAIRATFERGGKAIIPCFAVGRTQEVLYYIRELFAEGAFKGYEECPVFLDSPLAAEATAIFEKYEQGYYDEAAMKIVNSGKDIVNFKQLQLSISSDDSRAINDYKGSCIIISASGMCDAGRIRHHLKYNLWNEKTTVILVGFQAEGTIGRRLLEGEKEVGLLGDRIAVNATIENIDGLSAHADKDGLLRWLAGFEKRPSQVFVVHGETDSSTSFAEYISSHLGYQAAAPARGDVADLSQDSITITHNEIAEGLYIEDKSVVATTHKKKKTRVDVRDAPRYGLGNLIDALQELEQSGATLPRKKLETLAKAVDDVLRSSY